MRHLLQARFEWMEERVLRGAERNGYGFVTPAMNRLFAHMGGQPVGLSELARRLAVSRQAVHKLANEAARHAIVEFVLDEKDARITKLQFTAKGWAMSDSAAQEFEAIEAELQRQIGTRDLAELRRILSKPWDAERTEMRSR